MIILDTNIFFATMADRPDPRLTGWIDQQPWKSLHITAITVYEVQYGIEILATGARRRRLEATFERARSLGFPWRILPLDEAAAHEAAVLMGKRHKTGRQGDLRDTIIAGIAISRGAKIATRNLRHFQDLPVAVVDPWQ